MHSMFFNPIIEIEGQRKGFHMAISVNLKLFKRQKRNKINKSINQENTFWVSEYKNQ